MCDERWLSIKEKAGDVGQLEGGKVEVNEVVQVMEVWWDGEWCCVAAMPILAFVADGHHVRTATGDIVPRGNPHAVATTVSCGGSEKPFNESINKTRTYEIVTRVH